MSVAEICERLRLFQRERTVLIKSRIMLTNRLTAIVAGDLGYSSAMEENERAKHFEEARKLVKGVVAEGVEHKSKAIIDVHYVGVKALMAGESRLEKPMIQLAEQLPVGSWVIKPEQRGFGLLSLAVVVGEAGDLAAYSTVGKLWKRFGCAPHSFGGQTLMGATWKSGREGKLPAEEWERFGYSPRRRSLAFVIGENLMKLNKGEYRKRFDEAKAAAALAHPDWKPIRCHRHGMLLATKRLLRNLWCIWNKKPICGIDTDNENSGAVSA